MSPVTGRILSLEFEGGLRAAASKGNRVRGPHWKDTWVGKIVDPEGGSLRPAIYQTQTRVQALVEVDLQGTDNSGAPGTLTGRLGTLSLAGPISLSNGSHSVRVTQTSPLDTAITRYLGNATWTVTAPSPSTQAILANTTHLEVFVVLGPRPRFFQDGIWVEALRFLVQDVGLGGISNPHQVIDRITEHCHARHGLRYDSAGGATALGVTFDGGTFGLAAFLKGPLKQVQCFDISAAVLVLAGAAGISAVWLQVTFFGYIRRTNLVGVGDCNNPLFTFQGNEPVVDRLAQDRSRFTNHAFCELSSGSSPAIFDACVGPHLGTSNRQIYLANAADPTNFHGLGIPPLGNILPFTSLLKGVG